MRLPKTSWLWPAALCVVALGASLAWIAFWFEPQSLTVREISVKSSAWRGPPVKVALLSDIHGDQFHMPAKRIKSLALSVAALKPDVVFLGGDYVGGHFGQSHLPGAKRANRTATQNEHDNETVLALGNFKAPLGVYAVMGNHDCWWDCAQVRQLLETTNVNLLENRSVEVARPVRPFWIIGLEDSWTQNPDYPKARSIVPKDADILTLAHIPESFNASGNTAPIQFSGHSHGGQVRFPFIGAPVQSSTLTDKTVDTPLVEGARVLIVSNGLGETGLPVRFGIPPEIVIITVSNGPTLTTTTVRRTPIGKRQGR